jgi:hypothetical protein
MKPSRKRIGITPTSTESILIPYKIAGANLTMAVGVANPRLANPHPTG